MYTLLIVKTELTLEGINLDRNQRFAHRAFYCNPDVVEHTTVLLEKTFKTAKAAWQYLTPDLIDSLGLVYNGITYSTEFVDYTVDVRKTVK